MKLIDKSNFLVSELAECLVVHFGCQFIVYPYLTAVRRVQSAYDLKQCGLACSRSTHKGYYLARSNRKVDVFKHMEVAVGLVNIVRFYHYLSMFLGLKIA